MTDFETVFDGERWLGAALTARLPEPARTRWQPLRVGIVNLWEYDRAEFWFADGRLVLRGCGCRKSLRAGPLDPQGL